MSYIKVTKDNIIDDYLNDLDLFLNTSGEQGALSYIRYKYNGDIKNSIPFVDKYEWNDFLVDVVYETDIVLSLNKLIQEPTQENANAFKHECRCYVFHAYMDEVVDYQWGYVDKSEKKRED